MMKLSKLFGTALLVGTLAVVGCGDSGGGSSGNGNGNGDACDQLLARCDDCTGGEQAACLEVVNDGEIDACALLLAADPGGCPIDVL